MKTLLIRITAIALFAFPGCDRHSGSSPSGSDSRPADTRVERSITASDGIERSLSYSDSGIIFMVSYGSAGSHHIIALQEDIPKLQQAFSKFIEWAKTARENGVTDLRKEIVTLHREDRYMFTVTGDRISIEGPGGSFYKADADAFAELMNKLPEMKTEYAQAKEKATLFK